jgi:hypothetical protein
MIKLDWSEILLYFNFVTIGASLEEVEQAAMAYAEMARKDSQRSAPPVSSSKQEETVIANTE